MSAIESRIIAIMSRTAMVPQSQFTPERKLSELGIGSLEQIECVLSLEDELQIELNDRDFQGLQTVQAVVDAVTRAYNERQRART